ncbi:Chlorate reductase assembly chaperone protein [bacterium HR30]|nr:Chlorate reductase assembly chaperone protein [bacterium HR30]
MKEHSTVPGSGPLADGAAVSDEAKVLNTLRQATMYRLLATALSYPSEETLACIDTTAEQLAGGMREFAPLMERLCVCARTSDPTSLAAEYLRIFERDSPCSPREGSWNLQGAMSRPALLADISGFYSAFGVGLGKVLGDTEDHLAAELEFLGFLALKLAYALSTENDEGVAVVNRAIRAFWSDHVARFILPFARALEETTREEFYRIVARMLCVWAEQECCRLGVTLQETAEQKPGGALEADCFVCPFSERP